MSPIVRFQNVRLVKDGKLYVDDFWIKDGIIIDPEPLFFRQQKLADVNIDCKQLILAPGYIELQINGGFGHDFSSPDYHIPEALQAVSTNLVRYGVTSFCPTLVTQAESNYARFLSVAKPGPVKNGASILGVHLEGPFINVAKKGAHPEQYIQTDPLQTVHQVERVYSSLTNVSIITLAPELDHNNVIHDLAEKGLVVAMGHSNANLCQSEAGFRNGARMITHLFNAMPLFHHRDPGLLGLLTVDSDRQIYYGIIADGIHTHYSALRLAFQANPKGMVLVSDAISAAGLQSGIHMIGHQQIEIKDNKAFVANTNTLCGAIAMLDHCVRYFKHTVVNASLVDAIECATLHPAQVLGIEHRKGTLAFGSDADFILLSDELQVLATFVAGKCVFVHPQCPLRLEDLC